MAAPSAAADPYITPKAEGGGLFCQSELTSDLGTKNNLTGSALSTFIADMKRWYKHCHSDQSNYSNGGWVWGEGSRGASTTTLAEKLVAEGLIVSQYRNGSYVSQAVSTTTQPNGGEALSVETNHPLGIHVFWAGNYRTSVHTPSSADCTLAAAVNPTQTTLSVVKVAAATIPTGFTTGPGDYAPPATWPFRYDAARVLTGANAHSTSTAAYVPWVRIGEEVMILTAAPVINGANVDLTVRRGQWGTTAAAHTFGSKVLSPVYVGSTTAAISDANLTGPPGRNDSAKPLRYALNVLSYEAHRQLIDRINATFFEGHNGIWLDVSSSVQYNQADAWGNPLQGFDPASKQKITSTLWGRGQRKKAHAVRAAFPGKKVIGNNFADVISTAQDHLMDAAYDTSVLENFMLHDTVAGFTISNWVAELDILFRAMARNWGPLAWIRWNQGGLTMPVAQYKRFAYGCFLLAYRDTAKRAQVGGPWGPFKPDLLFFHDFGTPVGSPTSAAHLAVPGGEVGGDGLALHVRHYGRGLVVVNPNKSGAALSYALPDNQTWFSVALDGTTASATTASVGPLDAAFCLIDTAQTRVINGVPFLNDTSSKVIAPVGFTSVTGDGFGTSSISAGNIPITVAEFTEPVTQSEFQGTWALQQVNSQTDLTNRTAAINTALNFDNVEGFSMRVPWNAIDTNFDLLDQGVALIDTWNANHPGKKRRLMLRFMAGKNTPARVFNEGAYFYYMTNSQTYSATATTNGVANSKVPKPFNDAGVAGNPAFEANYLDLVTRLGVWCRANDVRMLHTSWYGRLYAEVDAATETIGSAPGWSQAAWLAGHKTLVDMMHAESTSDDGLCIEFAMSGYNTAYTGAQGALVSYMVTKWGAWNPRVCVQANVLGEYPNANAAGSNPIFSGMQMFNLVDYDWDGQQTPADLTDDVYPNMYKFKAQHIEVYVPSFALARAAILQAEITKFANRKEV